MAINLNSDPYFDDFDGTKNFHQILFKPGVAVQARELTQIQSILRDQIAKFGNHIFKHGSVVIPGNSYADLAVPFVKVESTYGGTGLNLSLYEGKVFVGATSGVEAYIKKTVGEEGADPVTFYLAYTKGSGENIKFSDGEEIYAKENFAIRATVKPSASTGAGSMAFVNAGVYYVNGTFVYTPAQSVVISKYDSLPSCSVLFRIVEEVIDADQDQTLLDPAQGSYNYAAPGADRVQITLVLTTLGLNQPINADFVELMRYNQGNLEEHARNPKYSELEKSLARRTFDESGNYVVQGISPSVREHLKLGTNGGLYEDGDINKFVLEVSPGKAYVEGFEVEKFSRTRIELDKARTPEHIKSDEFSIRPSFGQYILVSNLRGGLGVSSHEQVTLWNDSNAANGSATQLGSAKVLAIDYFAGDVNVTDAVIYKVWVTDLVLNSGTTIESVGGIRFSGSGYGYLVHEFFTPLSSGAYTAGEVVSHSSGRTAVVKYWNPSESKVYLYRADTANEIPKIGDLIVGATSTASSVLESRYSVFVQGTSAAIFELPKQSAYSLKTVGGVYNLTYTSQKELKIVTDGSGDGSVTIATGTIMPIEVGSFSAVYSGGNVSNTKFSLNVTGNTLTLDSGPTNTTVTVYCNVMKTDVSPKTKTKTLHNQVVLSPTAEIVLDKADIVELVSVIDGVGDVTANYNVWDGQTDYEYKKGKLFLKQGRPAPSGSITVSYYYFEHSTSGDFFCIDSYSGEPDYLDTAYVYNSSTSGNTYNLISCLDFRSTVGADDTMGGAGAKRNDLIVPDTAFVSNLRYFVPRIDTLAIDVSGRLNVITGIPDENPVASAVPAGQFALNSIEVPAYTANVYDIFLTRLGAERYRMQDIKGITNRIDRLEEFATLTAEEARISNYEIIDAETGLNRFKTGFLVETFTQPLTIARTTSNEFTTTFIEESLHAGKEKLVCALELDESNSSGYVKKGDYIMLPYTDVVFAQQPLSSRVTNLNPFVAISWNGIMDVVPPVDRWVEIVELPDVFETRTEYVDIPIRTPVPSAGGDIVAGPWEPSVCPKPASDIVAGPQEPTGSGSVNLKSTLPGLILLGYF